MRLCVGQREAGPRPAYVILLRRCLRSSPCCQPATAVQSCYTCGDYGGGQGSRPAHSCASLDKSPSREPSHCVASLPKETREMERDSVSRHRRKSTAQSRLHLSLRASRALGPDVFRPWKASDCRRLRRSHSLESARTRVETRASRIPHCPPWTSPTSENFTPALPCQLPETSPFGLGS